MPQPTDLDTTDHGERDAASIRILGFFFTVLGLLVLVATLTMLGDDAPAEEGAAAEQTETVDGEDASEGDAETAEKTASVTRKRGAIVNAVSGLVLALIGAGMLVYTKRKK